MTDKKKVWFLSDPHFSHKNILSFSPERFDILGLAKDLDKDELRDAYLLLKSFDTDQAKRSAAKSMVYRAVAKMDEAIVMHWNDLIGFSDDVYVLGDISFGKGQDAVKHLDRLNGRLHLVKGNHDHHVITSHHRWEWVKDYTSIYVNGQMICLFHYPVAEWDQMHRGAWHLHGHVHGSKTNIGGKIRDVAMEGIGQIAVSFEELAVYMKDKPVRKHGGSDENMEE